MEKEWKHEKDKLKSIFIECLCCMSVYGVGTFSTTQFTIFFDEFELLDGCLFEFN